MPLSTRKEIDLADKMVDRVQTLKKFLKKKPRLGPEEAKRLRRQTSSAAAQIREGDMVWLDCRNLKTDRPRKSLDYKNRGPFKVKRFHNNTAYELDLPPEMGKLCPIFHPWLLHLDDNDRLPGQDQHEPGPTRIYEDDYGEQKEDYEVTAILDSRIERIEDDLMPDDVHKGLLMYKVL